MAWYVNAARTSQTCSNCGFVNRRLKVTERECLCPCGATLDRDLNAAVNIEVRGKIPCLGVACPEARGREEAMTQERPAEGSNPAAEAAKSVVGCFPRI